MSSELKDPQFHARLMELIGKEQPFTWALRIGISKGAFHRIWNEGTVPGPEHLRRIADKTGCTIDWLLMGKQPKMREEYERTWFGGTEEGKKEKVSKEIMTGYVQVPRYEVSASAGGGAIIHSEQIVDYLSFKADWVNNALGIAVKDLALINVKGDSMEPSLSNGDLILIDLRARRVEDNAIYVLQFNGTLLVKRIQRKMDGAVVIKSDNKFYEPEVLNGEAIDQLKVVGRVVWCGRRM